MYGIAVQVAQIRPILDMARPILETLPEVAEEKTVVDRLIGGVEVSNVSSCKTLRINDTVFIEKRSFSYA